MEAPPGFEPGMEVLQTSALPLGDGAVRTECEDAGKKKWSGKRDSNPRLRPWQGRTLPLSYSRSSNFEKTVTHGSKPHQDALAAPALPRPRHQRGQLRRDEELFGALVETRATLIEHDPKPGKR